MKSEKVIIISKELALIKLQGCKILKKRQIICFDQLIFRKKALFLYSFIAGGLYE